MATFLDVGIIEYFVPFLVFVFVLIVLWALLRKVNFFPGNEFANLLIAFTLASLFIVIPELSQIVSLATPWFVVLLIFLFMLIMIFIFMGVDPKFIATVFGGEKPNLVVVWTIIVICFGIFGYAFTQVYGQQIHDITAGAETTTGGELTQNIGQILFTPKVLGMFFILIMASLIVRFVSAQQPAG